MCTHFSSITWMTVWQFYHILHLPWAIMCHHCGDIASYNSNYTVLVVFLVPIVVERVSNLPCTAYNVNLAIIVHVFFTNGYREPGCICCVLYLFAPWASYLHSLIRHRVICIGIHIINLRWSSSDIMGIPMPVRWRLRSKQKLWFNADIGVDLFSYLVFLLVESTPDVWSDVWSVIFQNLYTIMS